MSDGLMHPEWVEGRRLWMDSVMSDLIHRVRFGDSVKGWEGDDHLGVYWNDPDGRFELWRLEDDGEYRFVCRSGRGVGFDERIIDALLAWDRQRRKVGLAEEIVATNTNLEAQREQKMNEWVAEEMSPRLRHAWMKEL